MTATLKKYKLEELVFPGKGNLVSGPFGSNISSKFFVNDGVPVIRGNNLTKGNKKFIDDGYVYITNEKAYELRNCLANTDDILFTAAGTLGQIGIMPSNLKYEKYIISNKQIRLRCNTEIVNPTFLYYYLINPQMRVFIESQNKGSSIPLLTLGSLKWLPIDLPPLPAQQKIAKILSNYDDLIENNLKRIKLLEESARLTYEEWFLRFRIDGKKLEINPETKLPFGWEKIQVSDYVSTISKGPSLNYDLGTSKGVEVLNQSCIRNGEIELEKVLIAKELSDNRKSSYLRINDILINSMGQGTLGRVSKNVSIDERMIIHNCITYLRAKNIYSQYMLFYFISSHQEYFESLAQGSTGQSTLKKELVSNLLITLPKDKIFNKFDLIVSSKWSEIGTLKRQNKLLKEARDILLPRLMTGMIDTDDMDIAV